MLFADVVSVATAYTRLPFTTARHRPLYFPGIRLIVMIRLPQIVGRAQARRRVFLKLRMSGTTVVGAFALTGRKRSVGHQHGEFGVAEHVIGDAAGQGFPKGALGVGTHDEKIGVEARRLSQEHIAQVMIV